MFAKLALCRSRWASTIDEYPGKHARLWWGDQVLSPSLLIVMGSEVLTFRGHQCRSPLALRVCLMYMLVFVSRPTANNERVGKSFFKRHMYLTLTHHLSRRSLEEKEKERILSRKINSKFDHNKKWLHKEHSSRSSVDLRRWRKQSVQPWSIWHLLVWDQTFNFTIPFSL